MGGLTGIWQFAPLKKLAVISVEYFTDSKVCSHTGSLCCLENLWRAMSEKKYNILATIHKYSRGPLFCY